jgi:hypothetical protein
MSPDHGNFYNKLQSQYRDIRKPATPNQIQRRFNQSMQPLDNATVDIQFGHHNNKAEIARKKIFEFLKEDSYRSWIKGIEYDPERDNGDIVINLEDSTPQGLNLVDLIGYDSVSIHVGSSPYQLEKFVTSNLKGKERRLDWYKSNQVVLDGTLTANEVTLDLLFQMWILSDNLFVPNLAQQYISYFDDSTQLLLQTPHVMRPVIRRRRPIIEAFYKDECSSNIESDTRMLVEQFSLI